MRTHLGLAVVTLGHEPAVCVRVRDSEERVCVERRLHRRRQPCPVSWRGRREKTKRKGEVKI
jgi:hypothetical protein